MDPLKVSLPLIAGHFHLLEMCQRILMMSEDGTGQARVNSLQNATGVDKDVGFVFDDGIRIVALLNLDVPHLIILVPVSTHHSVVQPDVFVQVILLRDVLEILKNLWCP